MVGEGVIREMICEEINNSTGDNKSTEHGRGWNPLLGTCDDNLLTRARAARTLGHMTLEYTNLSSTHN